MNKFVTVSKQDLLAIHKNLINKIGGSHGLRDEGLLDSALAVPFASFGDLDFYQTTIEKAVNLAYSLINNHPFIDGNKRIGMTALLVTLKLNDITLRMTADELEYWGLYLAQDGKASSLVKFIADKISR